MPKGTKVSNCVEDVKAKGGDVNPYAVCQASTGESYMSGKPIQKSQEGQDWYEKHGRPKGSGKDWYKQDKGTSDTHHDIDIHGTSPTLDESMSEKVRSFIKNHGDVGQRPTTKDTHEPLQESAKTMKTKCEHCGKETGQHGEEEPVKMAEKLGPTVYHEFPDPSGAPGKNIVQAMTHSKAAEHLGIGGKKGTPEYETRGHAFGEAVKGNKINFPAKSNMGGHIHLTHPKENTQSPSSVEDILNRHHFGANPSPKEQKPIQEGRKDSPYKGKPSSVKTLKGVERKARRPFGR